MLRGEFSDIYSTASMILYGTDVDHTICSRQKSGGGGEKRKIRTEDILKNVQYADISIVILLLLKNDASDRCYLNL